MQVRGCGLCVLYNKNRKYHTSQNIADNNVSSCSPRDDSCPHIRAIPLLAGVLEERETLFR